MRLLMTLIALLFLTTTTSTAQRPKANPTPYSDANLVFARPSDSGPTIDMDLENASVRDALKQIFDRAKQEYVVDADVPQDARITVRARGVKLGTALDLVTQAGGIGWTRERKDSRTIYRIGKSVSSASRLRVLRGLDGTARVHVDPFDNLGAKAVLQLQPAPQMMGLPSELTPYLLQYGEERSTFTCPHCSGKTMMVRQRQQPKCAKCGRLFQRDWQFCPVDGARRPPAPGEWRFCPLCGKEVRPEAGERQRDGKSAAP